MTKYDVCYLDRRDMKLRWLVLWAKSDEAVMKEAARITGGLGKLQNVGERYAFGGWKYTIQSYGRTLVRSEVPPATLEQVVTVWWHRGMGTSPGMPTYYLREKARAREDLIPLSVLKISPGAKPVLPAGVKRLEDIEGYEPI